jgi:Protein of unknown function (DUF664)
VTQTSIDIERSALLSSLTNQRGHVLGILEGLSDEDLHRPVLASGWTCLGLVQHLAIDVERFWFRSIFAGEAVDFSAFEPSAWKVAPGVPAGMVFELYRTEIDAANAIIATSPLDTPPAAWPEERWPTWKLGDLRAMLLHVITETAVHAGHLDAVRELIDGRQWLVLG